MPNVIESKQKKAPSKFGGASAKGNPTGIGKGVGASSSVLASIAKKAASGAGKSAYRKTGVQSDAPATQSRQAGATTTTHHAAQTADFAGTDAAENSGYAGQSPAASNPQGSRNNSMSGAPTAQAGSAAPSFNKVAVPAAIPVPKFTPPKQPDPVTSEGSTKTVYGETRSNSGKSSKLSRYANQVNKNNPRQGNSLTAEQLRKAALNRLRG